MLWNRRVKFLLLAVLGLSVFVGGGWGLQRFLRWRTQTKVAELLKQGYVALAAETIDCHRHSFVKDQEGCHQALIAYFLSKRTDRLLWAAESCLSHGIQTPQVFLAKASFEELTGSPEKAIAQLEAIALQFKNEASIYGKLAYLYREIKRPDAARRAMAMAAEQNPKDLQFTLDALQFLTALEGWKESKALADRLKDASSAKDAEIKLLLARVYARNDDKDAKAEMVRQAKILMAATPESATRLMNAYADVLL